LRTIRTALTGLVSVCLFPAVLAGPAPAGSAAVYSLEVRPTRSVVWLETSLPEMEARRVVIRVFAPTGAGGRRELWQYCAVDYVGPGTYRCGVDFARGTAARRVEGTWTARLVIDGDVVARATFDVPGR
jgi:hypothetical protein